MLLATMVLAGCVVVVRQPAPDPYVMRVTKDGTEILLRQNYAKVKAGMDAMVIPNLERFRFNPNAAITPGVRVNESIAGEACRLSLNEIGINSASWHDTVIEARRVADGLTQVRAKSQKGRLNFILPGSTNSRDRAAERGRLTELLQRVGQ
jgi:hypothetical protein